MSLLAEDCLPKEWKDLLADDSITIVCLRLVRIDLHRYVSTTKPGMRGHTVSRVACNV